MHYPGFLIRHVHDPFIIRSQSTLSTHTHLFEIVASLPAMPCHAQPIHALQRETSDLRIKKSHLYMHMYACVYVAASSHACHSAKCRFASQPRCHLRQRLLTLLLLRER